MRLALAVAALAAFGVASWADECPRFSTITVKGTVHSLSVMREEPQAEQQSFFRIQVDGTICGKKSVHASAIGAIACKNGDAIEATGKFSSSPDEPEIGRLEVEGQVFCKARR